MREVVPYVPKKCLALQNIWNHLCSDLQHHLLEDQNPQSLYIYGLHHVLAVGSAIIRESYDEIFREYY